MCRSAAVVLEEILTSVMNAKGRTHSSYLIDSLVSSVLAPTHPQISGQLSLSSIHHHEAKLCTYAAQKLGMLEGA